MRKIGLFTVFAFMFFISVNGFAAKTVSPTTTLSAETGNNTSAADSFQGQSNGNPAAGNVSKVDTRTLMYSGSTTAIYAHYMPWFGTGSHVNIGYDTADPNQAARTVNDMISRGIQGVIIDWYGRNFSHEDQSTQAMFNEAQKHPGFQFAIMEDAGALKSGNPTSNLISDLIYANQKYQQSPNYMRINGRPAVFFFGVESLAIDWAAVRAQVPGNPIFIFQNANGLSASYSDAAFAWVNGFTSDKVNNWGQPYLTSYYNAATSSSRYSVGATWKGFNDSVAAWSAGRVLGQGCGQTWLNTFGELNKHYSSSKQLGALQIVTWNDYEEGTPIELGIENCVSVKASVSGNQLSWSISGGSENTIHHYTVFISTDGQNLMPVTDVASGTRSLDLGQFGFASGSYNIYVKAVGQPSIRNHMSGVVGWTSNGGGGSVSADPPSGTDLTLAANPASITVNAGSSASANVTLTPKGNFSVPVTLTCGNLPAGVSCSFSNSVLTPGSTAATTQLTLKANNTATSASLFGTHSTLALWFPGLGFGTFVFGSRKRSRKTWGIAALLAVLVMAVISTGCGGVAGKNSSSAQPSSGVSTPGTYQVKIMAQAGSFQRTTTATVIVK